MKDEQLSQGLREYAETRDRGLRDRLFEGLLPLSKAIAAKFTGPGRAREDLEQVAAMGLLKALERYEPERNLRFVTYAVPTITGDLRNYLRDKGSMVRAPRDARQRLYQMVRLQERFEQEHLRTPSAMELAQEMGITPEEMIALINLKRQTEVVSLDAPVDETGETGLADLLGEDDPELERQERGQWMEWILSCVTPQEKQLLLLRYEERLGQRETAKRMGVSQMQVSRDGAPGAGAPARHGGRALNAARPLKNTTELTDGQKEGERRCSRIRISTVRAERRPALRPAPFRLQTVSPQTEPSRPPMAQFRPAPLRRRASLLIIRSRCRRSSRAMGPSRRSHAADAALSAAGRFRAAKRRVRPADAARHAAGGFFSTHAGRSLRPPQRSPADAAHSAQPL